ncbi:MAG: two-component regulator propeller domain-containing protein, partial [Bacteroidota bacterium]
MVSRITVSAFLIHSFLSLFGQPLQFRFHTYPPTGDLESNIIYCINEDRMGFIWLGTNNGLYRFDGIDFKRYARSIFTANVDVNDILVDKHGDLWIGGVNGLWHMDRGTEQITSIWEEISLPPSIVTSLAAHRDGSIWVGTHEGLYQLDPVGHQLIAVYRADTMGLSSDDVFDLHVDREGSLWVATAAGGLNRLAPEASEFVSYQNDPLDRYSISSNVLRNLAETMDGKILVGTEEQGLNLLDPKTARFNRFNHDPKNSNSLSTTSAFTP